MSKLPPIALTIAGSDSSGGAGIQADLKTFTALRVYGASAITAITAQNSLGVHGVMDITPDMVASQMDAVLDDLEVDAVKSGMLSNQGIIEVVADRLKAHKVTNYVLDPVMVSESGHRLLQPEAYETLTTCLFPLALIVTPNLPEAEVLVGHSIKTLDDLHEAARAIADMGPRYVLMKGGHLEAAQATDYLYDGNEGVSFTSAWIDTVNTHGTGCTYAAAITACLARGLDVRDAVRDSKLYITGAIESSFDLGEGPGPLNHFWDLSE